MKTVQESLHRFKIGKLSPLSFSLSPRAIFPCPFFPLLIRSRIIRVQLSGYIDALAAASSYVTTSTLYSVYRSFARFFRPLSMVYASQSE